MRALRLVRVEPEGTTVKDINGKTMHLDGLTLGHPELEALLQLAGASYDPRTLHNASLGQTQTKDFQIVKQDPWGHDRVL